MDAADLKAFSDELIRRAKDELGSMVEAARKERMLSKAEVKELFGVCDATLWHWDRKGILKPVKTGNKVLYPEHEVRKALGQRNQNPMSLWKKTILFPLGYISCARKAYRGIPAEVRALSGGLYGCFVFHCICSRYGQYLVSPFHDRVGQPSHSLCGTGWPAQLRQDTSVASGGSPAAQTG